MIKIYKYRIFNFFILILGILSLITAANYSNKIESVSCDEIYIDATEALDRLDSTPVALAQTIRSDFFERSGGLSISVGIGPSRLTARMATNKAKPDGIFEGGHIFFYVTSKDSFLRLIVFL
jgi:hypothetical protein